MGYNVTLECEASGRGLLAYLWEKRESGGDWTIVDDSNTTTYTTSISGLYQCNVSNEAGSVVSNNATVNVYGEYCAYMYATKCIILTQVPQKS